MYFTNNFLQRNPGNENESVSGSGNNANENSKLSEDLNSDGSEKDKTFKEKIHDALQDWINKDSADQAFDDTQP